VLKLDLHDDRQKQKAMEAITSLNGIQATLFFFSPARLPFALLCGNQSVV
jgi:hypothetical protein